MRLDQPFYVPLGKGKVNLHTGQQGGYYLPALEEPEPKDEQPEPQWNKRQWDYVKQLKSQVIFLTSKVNEMRANASKRNTYTIK